MSSSSHAQHPAYKPGHADTRTPVKDAPGYEIERTLTGYAYAKSGNVHNASPRYRYTLFLNGKRVDTDAKRAPLIAGARNDSYAE